MKEFTKKTGVMIRSLIVILVILREVDNCEITNNDDDINQNNKENNSRNSNNKTMRAIPIIAVPRELQDT